MNKEGKRYPFPASLATVTKPLENERIKELDDAPFARFETVAKIPGNINREAICLVRKMLREIFMSEMRERRSLTYDVTCSITPLRDSCLLSIRSNALKPIKASEIRRLLSNCIGSIAERERLFNRTKRQLIAENLMVDLTGQNIRDNVMFDLVCNDKIVRIVDTNRDLDSMTMDDVRGILQWLEPECRWTFIATPSK
jgi:predicted Zn-dependent peptidase